jgi:effector-binding domain-containing protein
MRPLSILLSALLAFSFVALGCEKKAEEPAEPEAKAEELAKAEEPAKEEAPAETAVKLDAEVAKILDAAIEATGGTEKLKAFESFVINDYHGEYMGVKSQGKLTVSFKDLHMRLDCTKPAGEVTVVGTRLCWEKHGQVVTPVEKSLAELRKYYEPLFRGAMLLWPLKEEPGWQIATTDDVKLGDKTYKALKVSPPGIEKEATYLFDPESHHMVAMRLDITIGEHSGEFINEYAEFKDVCGIKFHTKETMSFMGQRINTEEMGDIKCQPVDPKIFEKPQQVADGTIVEKETQAGTVACTKMKGPYEKTGKAIEELMGFMTKQKLVPAGAPMMVYLKGPPKVKKPKKYLTEICLPVAAQAPKKPKKKGKFVIKAMKSRKVLAAYGVGPYEKKSPELVKLLTAEAKKRKLKTAGPMCQISFMDPKETAAEELVSEMQIPIK